jgi:hypothetical protein
VVASDAFRWWTTGAAVLALIALAAPPAAAQRFLPDDPIWEDPDRLDMPVPEQRSRRGDVSPFDFLRRTFGGAGTHSGPAANVNTLGAVPNSSWYTNRHYRDRLSRSALRRGPNDGPPPDTTGPWEVVGIETRHGRPAVDVRDAAGRTYELRFDPAGHPDLATGAAMVSSRLLHAFGYNVPEHHLVALAPGRLDAGPDSGVAPADVRRLLDRVPAAANGTIRAVATRVPKAVSRVGPFRFYGTRPDDGNDIFPHEARRELRGLRVFAAWLNHNKIRSDYTLDVVVAEDGRRFVRHFLTDLGATLGSAGSGPKPAWAGHEHVLELSPVLTRMGTAGLSGGEWMEATAPDLRGVGAFEAAHFRPEAWRPEYPNPAFERCDAADAFWAAKQIAHLRRSELEAIVETADYAEPAAAQYVVETLWERRAALLQAYLGMAGGLDRFAVRDGRLRFADLPARHGLVPDSTQRTVTWHVFNNEEAATGPRLRRDRSARETLALPERSPPFLRVSLRTPGRGATQVYLRRTARRTAGGAPAYEVVGVDRLPGPGAGPSG